MIGKTKADFCQAAKLSDAQFSALDWEDIEGMNRKSILENDLKGATILNIETVEDLPGSFFGLVLTVMTQDKAFKAYMIDQGEEETADGLQLRVANINPEVIKANLFKEG